jgi:hypothetical protein
VPIDRFDIAGGAAQSPFSLVVTCCTCRAFKCPAPISNTGFLITRSIPTAFVSDGKLPVTFPKALQSKFNAAKFKKLQAVPY